MYKTLTGDWRFRRADQGDWMPAKVPGCNFLDLMAAGKIPDPFVGMNEKEVGWVGHADWVYEKQFTVTAEELQADAVYLRCDMLDTICDVMLNGHRVLQGKNCFVPYRVPVKERLQVGENTLTIRFYSPVEYVSAAYKKCMTPMNSNGQNGIVHIRKPQCHFGWDWGPVLPVSGITEEIGLDFVDTARVAQLSVRQQLQGDGAVITAKAQVEQYGDCTCTLQVTCPDGTVLTEKGTEAVFKIEKPELWWTRELSGKDRQPLYTVSAVLTAKEKELDRAEKRVGLRTIELNRERDPYGMNFQFRLNGVPLFIKGSNLIPPDSFITRFDDKKLEALLDAAQFANLNMLRVWGGGYYASDAFYDACDRRGLLVWQDFGFACQAYPFFLPEFLENVKTEVHAQVQRLCHHPSLAVWCGNNEIEDMHMAWVHMQKYVQWTEKFFYEILEPEIRAEDPDTPYTPGSPVGIAHNEGVYSDNVGDTHLWGVWHGLQPMQYYRKRMTRFCSEFGFESLPDAKAIRQYAKPGDYALNSPVFNLHQKCASGNDKMVYYIASRFHLPRRFWDYIYLSQVTQDTCIADATEHWRRHKGQCNGAMYWQFNDCWGVCSWSSLDYYGNYKALQYGARRFNAPLSVSVEDSKERFDVYVLNDLNARQTVTVEYELFDFVTGTLEKEKKKLLLPPVENAVAFSREMAPLRKKYDLRRTGLAVRLVQNGACLQQKTVLFDQEKRLQLPGAKLHTEHWRRHKGQCNGAMYWQFNDCWGVCSWSSLDYYGNYKALQYGARRFNAPLSVSVEDSKERFDVYVLNDLNARQTVTVEYELFDFVTGTLEKEKKKLLLPPVENAVAFSREMAPLRKKYDLRRTGLAVRLVQNGACLQQKTVLFDQEKRLQLPGAKLHTKVEIQKDQLCLTVTTDRFARLVHLESSRTSLPFSDNYFDLLPGQSHTVTLAADPDCTLRELAESIRVKSLSDVPFDRDPLHAAAKRIKVYLSPVNIGNAIHHGKLSKDIQL